MKIIDLLNKIANGEELPKKIYCFNREFHLKGNTYFGDTFTLMHYIQEEDLNTEVEILEEEKKIPEKIEDILHIDDLIPPYTENIEKIWIQTIKNHNKINEICDYLEYLKSKGE